MSLSFRIVGGDLHVSAGRSFETVSGAAKLAQDLELWVLEHIGTDPATPQYGSRLDGGIINGSAIESFIGQSMTDARVAEAKQEISGLLSTYQQNQVAKMQREMLLYNGNHTLLSDEVLSTIDRIEAKSVGDQLIIRVSLTTLAGTQFKLTLPVGL